MTKLAHFLLVAALPAGLAHVNTDYVLSCDNSATYVDGGLYVKKTSDGTTLGDIGDAMNGTQKFPLNFAVTQPQNYTCCGPQNPLLLTEKMDAARKFKRLDLTPYIDVSAGAFAPLRFTSDNSTLSAGETTWGWMTAYGFIMWSPTGHLKDVPPAPKADGSQELHPNQGWQLVPTQVTDIYQIYWNQTRFEKDVVDKAVSHPIGQCYGNYPANNNPLSFVDDL